MPKYISVAESYAIYEVQDDVFEVLSNGTFVQPPQVVLEVLTMTGVSKKIGSVSSFGAMETEVSEDDEPAEGEGPWVE